MISQFRSTLATFYSQHIQSARIVFLSHFASALAAFFLQLALARLLVVSEFGVLAGAMAINAVFEGIALSRGNETALSVFSKHHDVSGPTIRSLLSSLARYDLAWVGGCVVTYVILIVSTSAQTEYRTDLVLLLASAALLQFPWGTIKAALFVLHPPEVTSRIELQSTCLSLVLFIVGMTAGGAQGFCAAYSLAQGLKVILGMRAVQVSGLNELLRHPAGHALVPASEITTLSLAGAARAALSQFIQQMDIIILSILAPGPVVAHYRAAKTVANLPSRAAAPLWVLARKTIVMDASGGRPGHFAARFGAVAILLGLAGATILLPTIIYGEELLTLLFGAPYAASAPAYAWLAPGAWLLLVVTGWSGFYSSVSPRRLPVILLFLAQASLFPVLAVALNWHSAEGVACLYALAQSSLALAFWILLLKPRVSLSDEDKSELPK